MVTPRRRLSIATVSLVGTLALLGPAPRPDTPDNRDRLRAMPPELRNHLSEQLKAFSLLDRSEQEAVRTLDRKIASETEEDRATDYAVLRRYHLWLQTLTEVQRNELTATPPSKRLAVVSKILAERKDGEGKPETWLDHYADFNGASPFDLAQRVGTWLKMSDAQRAEVARLPDLDRQKRMGHYARELKVSIPRPTTAETDALYHRALESGRFPYLKKAEETKKQPQVKHRFVDHYYFVEHPPEKVNPDKLLEFDRALPVWVRGNLDTLPPDEARRRLTILYRLVYPRGEIQAAGKPPAPPTPDRPASTGPPPPPAPKKAATGVSPF